MAARNRDLWNDRSFPHRALITARAHAHNMGWFAFLERPELAGEFDITGRVKQPHPNGGGLLWTYEVICTDWLTLLAFGLQYECDR